VEFKDAEDREALVAAIDAGELRVLDLLYVATAPLARMNYEDSEAHCAELQVGGLSVFRLPSPDEIKTIRRGRMLDRGRFWTNKPAGKGFVYLLDTEDRKSISKGRPQFAGARAVCVRER
jgi:hypothetical protein